MRAFAFFAALSLAASSAVAGQDNECTFESCKAGTRATTYATKTEPFYACPSRELATYVTTVIGFEAIQAALGVPMPNVSDQTGEFEYTGETKATIDMMRHKAGVQTFDQAVAICSLGANKRKVMVLNMPEDSVVAYVEDEARKLTFWMPISSLDRLR